MTEFESCYDANVRAAINAEIKSRNLEYYESYRDEFGVDEDGCFTLPNGECIGTDCIHIGPPS